METNYTFEVYKATNDKYYWRLTCDDNWEIVGASSQGFSTSTGAKDNAKRVKWWLINDM